MKGIIFTEFLEMVGEVFSPQIVESIIEAAKLPNQGAYTEVGTYDYRDLLNLVTQLSIATNIPIEELELSYGQFLFTKFLKRYPTFVLNAHSAFEFLKQVDSHIHVEVLKLYPDAELPKFICTMINQNCMQMNYQSNHPFKHLAKGLILGCAKHFNEEITVESKELPPLPNKQTNVLFTLTKQA